ncbi:MAG: transporter permease [Pseudonocardiales bacterium]|nr:transporter permease [Pseudonocardiales bacterium]
MFDAHSILMGMTGIIGFPNPVNEKAARSVAGGVLALSVATLVLSMTAGDAWLWLVAVIALGFVARVLTGPTLSPLGQLATRVVAPKLGAPKLVAGPPKRFAQAVGAAVTIAGVAFLAAGYPGATQALLGVMIVAAGLESIFAYCIGCTVFTGLMRIGLVPAETCAACANIALHNA